MDHYRKLQNAHMNQSQSFSTASGSLLAKHKITSITDKQLDV